MESHHEKHTSKVAICKTCPVGDDSTSILSVTFVRPGEVVSACVVFAVVEVDASGVDRTHRDQPVLCWSSCCKEGHQISSHLAPYINSQNGQMHGNIWFKVEPRPLMKEYINTNRSV